CAPSCEPRRFEPCAWRVWTGINQHATSPYHNHERRDFFSERWRRGAAVRGVLVPVPRAHDTAVHDPALAKRPLLMLADVGDGGHAVAVLEHGDTLAADAPHDGAPVGNLVHSAHVHEHVLVRLCVHVAPGLAEGRGDMKANHPYHTA